MPRDKEIKKAFEVADDAMQGVVGYFLYVKEVQQQVNQNAVIKALPPQLQITFEWARNYNPNELVMEMDNIFLHYHARIALTSLISYFEAALKNFMNRLTCTNHIKRMKKDTYKARLEWAFELTSRSIYGTDQMRERIPDICLHIDHDRRVRNLWMHNNGLLNEWYEKDAIEVSGREPIIVDTYEKFRKDNRKKVPCILIPDAFHRSAYSHIELLHYIHDTIQRKYFGQKRAYGYRSLKKKIEWHRILIGK